MSSAPMTASRMLDPPFARRKRHGTTRRGCQVHSCEYITKKQAKNDDGDDGNDNNDGNDCGGSGGDV